MILGQQRCTCSGSTTSSSSSKSGEETGWRMGRGRDNVAGTTAGEHSRRRWWSWWRPGYGGQEQSQQWQRCEGQDVAVVPRRKGSSLRKGTRSTTGNSLNAQPRRSPSSSSSSAWTTAASLTTTASSSSNSRRMMMDEPESDRFSLAPRRPRTGSKLIVYEWDPVYTLTQQSGYSVISGGLFDQPQHQCAPPPVMTFLLPAGLQPVPLSSSPSSSPGGCCPSLIAPGSHSLLLQESSS